MTMKCVCRGNTKDAIIVKNGVRMMVKKCGKCGEIYIPGSEMLKYDIIKGKSSLARKIRKSGDSLVVTVPKQIVDRFGVRGGDIVAFELGDKEIKLKIVHV